MKRDQDRGRSTGRVFHLTVPLVPRIRFAGDDLADGPFTPSPAVTRYPALAPGMAGTYR